MSPAHDDGPQWRAAPGRVSARVEAGFAGDGVRETSIGDMIMKAQAA